MVVAMLASGPLLAAEPPKALLGSWAPGPCAGVHLELRHDRLTLWSAAGGPQVFGALSVDLTCFSGANRDSDTICISPLVGGRFPFSLVFDPDGHPGSMRFDVMAGDRAKLPTSGQLWRRCDRG